MNNVKMNDVKMNDSACKTVFTLNTWTEEKKQEVRNYLSNGFWVRLASSAMGHTMSKMVENDGRNWVNSEYKDKIQWAIRKGWGDIYCRIANSPERRKTR